MPDRSDWQVFSYATQYRSLFDSDDCQRLIEAADRGLRVHSVFPGTRDSEIFWLERSQGLGWAFDRIEALARTWNAPYQYDISAGIDKLQLTHYQPGQFYRSHVDLGAGPACKRRISVVCQLSDPSSYQGGGLTVLYDMDKPWKVPLSLGDAVVFHSWVQHRAETVTAGDRWMLVAWVNGSEPLR